MAAGETYEEFVEKFKQKLTTDDCYTPSEVYDCVADWAAEEYGLDRADFVRPFWPGGDYHGFDYPDGCVVVDNPPFSIISKICQWYAERDIRFFLFAPSMTIFSCAQKSGACAVCAYADIEYENGAIVKTSFLTNLEDCAARSAPELYRRVSITVEALRKKKKPKLQKYEYPPELLTANDLNRCSLYGVALKIRREDAAFVRGLDSQKEHGKTIFGAGYLLSEKAAAEKAAAEKAAAYVWDLSDREREIIRKLVKE